MKPESRTSNLLEPSVYRIYRIYNAPVFTSSIKQNLKGKLLEYSGRFYIISKFHFRFCYYIPVNARLQQTPTSQFLPREHMRGGLGSRNSVCSCIRPSHAWIVTKLNDALQIFLYHMRGQSLCYSDTKSGWWATPLPFEICAQSDPPPSKYADFDRFPLKTSQPWEIAKKVQLRRI